MRCIAVLFGAMLVSCIEIVAAYSGCASDRSYCESNCSGPFSTPGLFEGLGGGPNLFSVLAHGDCERDCETKYETCRRPSEDREVDLPHGDKDGDKTACSVEFLQQKTDARGTEANSENYYIYHTNVLELTDDGAASDDYQREKWVNGAVGWVKIPELGEARKRCLDQACRVQFYQKKPDARGDALSTDNYYIYFTSTIELTDQETISGNYQMEKFSNGAIGWVDVTELKVARQKQECKTSQAHAAPR